MAHYMDRWRRASFRGAEFHVDVGVRASGRRAAIHEFPKRDVGYVEDMGRRIRRHPTNGYVVGPEYKTERDALIDALEREGPGTLVHPTLGTFQVVCIGYNVTERREKGGLATFEMEFVEAGEETGETFYDVAGDRVQSDAVDTASAIAAVTNEEVSVSI